MLFKNNSPDMLGNSFVIPGFKTEKLMAYKHFFLFQKISKMIRAIDNIIKNNYC